MPQFQDKQSLIDFLKDDDQNEEDVLFDAARATTQNGGPDINRDLADSVAAEEAAQKAAAEEAAAKEAAAKEAAERAAVRKSAKTAAFQEAVKQSLADNSPYRTAIKDNSV